MGRLKGGDGVVAITDTFSEENKTVTVWRVELPDGTGPYHSEGIHRIYEMEASQDDDDHPSPWMDGIWKWDGSYGFHQKHNQVCGFKDEEQMNQWFEGWFEELDRAGYQINTYEVPVDRVWYGKRQVTFIKENSHEQQFVSPVDAPLWRPTGYEEKISLYS